MMQVKNTLKEQLQHIHDNYSLIFVREEINGKFGSHPLSGLPDHLAHKHVIHFLERYKNENSNT